MVRGVRGVVGVPGARLCFFFTRVFLFFFFTAAFVPGVAAAMAALALPWARTLDGVVGVARRRFRAGWGDIKGDVGGGITDPPLLKGKGKGKGDAVAWPRLRWRMSGSTDTPGGR